MAEVTLLVHVVRTERDFLPSLEHVHSRIDEALEKVSGELRAAARHLFESGGKGIRPRLVLLSAEASLCGTPPNERTDWEAVRDVAAAAEMIHVASLIHDDIIDGADFRRSRRSVNHMWTNHTAVLAGDYLFASAFGLLGAHAHTGVVTLMTNAIADMCKGELLQKEYAFDPTVSEATYTTRVRGKTASLLAACCEGGARLVHAEEGICEAMRQFGLNLGLAFQIMDDLLDIEGDEETLGKPTGSDLVQGNLTLPVIRLLERPHWRQRIAPRIAARQVDAETITLVKEGARATGAIDAARATGHMLALEALHYLNILDASEAGRALQSLCHAAVDRDH